MVYRPTYNWRGTSVPRRMTLAPVVVRDARQLRPGPSLSSRGFQVIDFHTELEVMVGRCLLVYKLSAHGDRITILIMELYSNRDIIGGSMFVGL